VTAGRRAAGRCLPSAPSPARGAAPRSSSARSTARRPSPARLAALQKLLLEWYADNGRDLPWRHTTDPYAVLVSEVMLQQTQVPRVVARYPAFLERFPTLESLAAAPLPDVLAAWLGLGYNNRALRLKRCAEGVPDHHRLPDDLEGLRALPGVGAYTARAVLIFAYNADLAAVDANVRRVLTHELDLPRDLSLAELQAVAEAALPHGRSRDWHNALMDYGSLVLTARATGIAPLSRQKPFAGSHRQRRARLLRRLLERGPLSVADAAAALDLTVADCRAVVDSLAADGLVALRRGRVTVCRH
jgi:A/G-specific adenine glycosylase